jgi:hypothetical protein
VGGTLLVVLDRFRFSVDGRFDVVLERINERWHVLEVGDDGKRSDLQLAAPEDVQSPDECASGWRSASTSMGPLAAR